jgi:hypothetical protein
MSLLQRIHTAKGYSLSTLQKKTIFSTDPGTNAVIYLVSFGVIFALLWTGINWFAKVQTEQNLRDAQQQVDKMLNR